MEKLKMHSPNLTDGNIARIRELFPGCVTEARDESGALKLAVDFDQLKQELSDSIVEGPQERYHLNWPGKREALLTANAPIAKTLRPCREESVDFDTTKNLFIEGDNLDALKLLQETYLGKVKMIYIDPPYNTGNDFIYEDDFAENADEFLLRSNQKDEEGNRLVANTESNGRFHSDWLSMMYPRLKLARNLLRDDGVIFCSIGVQELPNIKKIMDEIFGEANFIEIFSWVKTSTPPALSTKSRKTNEYIICYEKNRNSFKYKGEPLDGGDQPLLNTGNALRELKFPKDKVMFSFIHDGLLSAGAVDRVTLLQDLNIKNRYATSDIYLAGEFKWTQEFLDEEIKNGTTFIVKSDKLSIRFIRQEEGFKRPTNYIKDKYTSPLINKKSSGVGTNETASSELIELMGLSVFSYPKPVTLIDYLINFIVEENDIVMDFFAGSGTTAEAVFEWSAKNNKRTTFILVQIQEDLEKALKQTGDPGTKITIQNGIDFLKKMGLPLALSELTKVRIQRSSKKILAKYSIIERDATIDTGFRVLKIGSSNMAEVYYTPDAVKQEELFGAVDNIKPDRTPEDLLFQVLLDLSVDLSLPIRKETIQEKTVFFVDENALVACFDTELNEELVRELAQFRSYDMPIRKMVFRDNGFTSDAVKINVEQIFRQLSPGTEVKSI